VAFSAGITCLTSRFACIGAGLAGALLALLLAGAAASAQDPAPGAPASLEARKEVLFQQMLREPANLDVIFAYADASAKLGDNEAAVSALERMLLFNPNLPRVQVELGALYFRMGSYEIARTYFEKALAAAPPPEVRSRIDTYLAEIERLSAKHRLTGSVFTGAQYQTNANLAPGSGLILSPLGLVTLDPQFVKRADWNIFGAGSALYAYDLGTQNRDTFEVTGVGFANHYFRVNRLDLGVVETTAGPRLNFPRPLPAIREASLKPYGIANYVSLGSSPYFHTFGAGAEATAVLPHEFRLKSAFEFREKNFQDARDRPLSRGFTGSDKFYSLFLAKPITSEPFSELALEVDLLRQDTRLGWFSNWTYGGAIAYRVRYQDPVGLLPFPWETSLFFSGNASQYDDPDPCCNVSGNPAVFQAAVRSDRRFRFGLTQTFQVAKDVAVIVQLQRDIVSSNIPLYAYSGNSILIGPQIRF
jgi:tetratricopeptide (TPR) repeat protein